MRVTGRFNYLPISKDRFNILFVHENGGALIIATNLTFEQMDPTVKEMNESLFLLKQDIRSTTYLNSQQNTSA